MFIRIKPALIIEICIHLLFWALIIFTPIISRPDMRGMPQPMFSTGRIISFNLVLAAEFYLNAFFLIPKVLKANILLYFLSLLTTLVFFNLVLMYIRPHFPMPNFPGMGEHRPPPGPFL